MSYRNTSGLVPYQQQPDLAKQAARQSGLKRFAGSRCKNGHPGTRYTSTGHCVDCMKLYNNKLR